MCDNSLSVTFCRYREWESIESMGLQCDIYTQAPTQTIIITTIIIIISISFSWMLLVFAVCFYSAAAVVTCHLWLDFLSVLPSICVFILSFFASATFVLLRSIVFLRYFLEHLEKKEQQTATTTMTKQMSEQQQQNWNENIMPNLLHTSAIMALAYRAAFIPWVWTNSKLRQLNQYVCYLGLDYCYSIAVVSGNFMSIGIELLLLLLLMRLLLSLFRFSSFDLCAHLCLNATSCAHFALGAIAFAAAVVGVCADCVCALGCYFSVCWLIYSQTTRSSRFFTRQILMQTVGMRSSWRDSATEKTARWTNNNNNNHNHNRLRRCIGQQQFSTIWVSLEMSDNKQQKCMVFLCFVRMRIDKGGKKLKIRNPSM